MKGAHPVVIYYFDNDCDLASARAGFEEDDAAELDEALLEQLHLRRLAASVQALEHYERSSDGISSIIRCFAFY